MNNFQLEALDMQHITSNFLGTSSGTKEFNGKYWEGMLEDKRGRGRPRAAWTDYNHEVVDGQQKSGRSGQNVTDVNGDP